MRSVMQKFEKKIMRQIGPPGENLRQKKYNIASSGHSHGVQK